MRELLSRFRDADRACECVPSIEGDRLTVAADGCPGRGDLVASPDCRATAVDALDGRVVSAVVARTNGTERRYDGRATALLTAASRFAGRIASVDAALAERARRDPLAAAREASGRAGRASTLAAETGLVEVADDATDYANALRPLVGLSLARSRIAATPPPDGRLVARRDVPSGATVRVYERPARELRTYHLEPVEATLDDAARETLHRARSVLADGAAGSGERAPLRAVRRVAGDDASASVTTLADVLRKHTRGYGVLEDVFGDERVTDAFASAPAATNDLRVTVDGESMRTNVRLTAAGAAALASQLRRSSGRAFSRASPALDAVAEGVGVADRVRAAAVAEPLSDGYGFALRAHGDETWTLPRLVAAGTVPAEAAALLSLAVEGGAAILAAGTRGAGKTTLLAALLWELPAATRTVVMEDTPELPVRALQSRGRDVQALRTDLDDDRGTDPREALRTALRLGEGALVVGEVRGEEAQVLYEAMRVGANGSAVLGTVHGDGAREVRERVVADLGVPAAAFGATDLVVTLDPGGDDGGRRLAAVEEVVAGAEGTSFAPLFDSDGSGAAPTGRIDRGNSDAVAALAGAGESYGDVRDRLARRSRFLGDLVADGRTDPDAIVDAYARRRGDR